jgi:hypothetical protein
MAARIELDPDFEAKVLATWDEFAEQRLGPDIADDARRYAPKRTGALADSIESHVEDDHKLIVSATGSEEREYAAYVELGHRVYHPSTGITGPEVVPAEPYLRPALYQERGE